MTMGIIIVLVILYLISTVLFLTLFWQDPPLDFKDEFKSSLWRLIGTILFGGITAILFMMGGLFIGVGITITTIFNLDD